MEVLNNLEEMAEFAFRQRLKTSQRAMLAAAVKAHGFPFDASEYCKGKDYRSPHATILVLLPRLTPDELKQLGIRIADLIE